MVRRRSAQRGAMAVVVALSLPLLLGLTALVLDLGRAYVLKAELQNAMDGCALAASAHLTGANDASLFDAARAAALALTDPGARGQADRPAETVNRVHFQSEMLQAGAIEVAFSGAVDGPFVPATAADTRGLSPGQARFARCRYTDPPRALWMLPVLEALGVQTATTVSMPAEAVASLMPAQQVCAVPMAVCTVGNAPAQQRYGLKVGDRLTAVTNPGSGYGQGQFGWLDFDPPNGGASELRELLEGSGACDVRRGQAVGQAGQLSSINRSWNTRFGLYGQLADAAQAAPDLTGWGFTSGRNQLANYLGKRAEHAAFQGQVGNSGVKLSVADHARLGQQRRIVTAPVVNCNEWNAEGGATPAVLDLACMLMLAPVRVGSGPTGTGVALTMDLEFLGLVGDPGAPCSSTGVVGRDGGAVVPGLVQ